MEKQLNFTQKLSLQELAIRKSVVNLWNETDVLDSIVSFRVNPVLVNDLEGKIALNKELQEIVSNMVKVKVAKLVMPESVKKQMIQAIKPIGAQLLKWKFSFPESHDWNDSSDDWDIDILKQLHWTSLGTIDYQKTAVNLVRLKSLDVIKRYKLACFYCLVEYLQDLWKELSGDYKRQCLDSSKMGAQLEFYWSTVLQFQEMEQHDFDVDEFYIRKYAFECSARLCNKAATEYFFQKLTPGERDAYFLQVVFPIVKHGRKCLNEMFYDFPMEKLCDVLCYLFSQMTHEQLMLVLKKYPREVLTCFLEWPWQDFFLEIADLIWTFLPGDKYILLLDNLIENIAYSDVYSPTLIQEFFLRSPTHFKQCFVDYEAEFGCLFISNFFKDEDEESIKVIFKNIDADDRMRLASCDFILRHFDNPGNGRTWPLVELCLRETVLSQEDKDRFKEACTLHLTRMARYKLIRSESRERQLKLLLKYLEEIETPAVGDRDAAQS